MKPIKLRLSGLQSYREAQVVDFERLCEAGVFGIFGSTGSGKSSILDAVTLALYGKVERAASGTQGIMNQEEKQLSVAFTFELSGGGEKRRYRVERQFKRSGDQTISSSLSRFVEIAEAGDIVIADKLAEVTRCVEERIGLNMQDFTRAVVLPQGKFAEFLSLTGKDRRSMLQRLFRLERFGDGLSLKLNQRMKAAEGALSEAAAEQLGLGDASAEAVNAAEKRHQEAASAASAARLALADAERLHAERLHVRERVEALRAKEALQGKLLADQPRIAALERELQRLGAAERLMPALAAAQAAEAALRAAASRREAAGLAHAARLAEAASAAAAWTAAAEAAEASEPRLARRLDQLAQAQRLEGEAAALAAELAGGQRRCADAAGRQQSFGEQAAKAQEKLGRAAAKQSELKAELKAAELTQAERAQRGELAKRLQLVEGLREQLDAARMEAASEVRQLAEVQAALDAAETAKASAAAVLDERLAQLDPMLAGLHELEAQLQQLNARLPEWLVRVRREQSHQQRHELAAKLAAELLSGEACPVCGSCEHPSLHGNGGAGAVPVTAEEDIAAWEALQQQAQTQLMQIAPLRGRVESTYERLLELCSGDAGTEQAALRLSPASWSVSQQEAAVSSEIAEDDPASPDRPSKDALVRIQQTIAAAAECYAIHNNGFTSMESGLAAARSRFNEDQRRRELAAGELASRSRMEQAAGEKAGQRQEQMKRELASWQEQFGMTLPPERAQEVLDQFEKRDNAAHELRGRVEKSIEFIEATARQVADDEKQAAAAELEKVELTAKIEHLSGQLERMRSQLEEWTGGQAASRLLAEAEKELRESRSLLKKCKEMHETAQSALQAAAEQRSASTEAESSAVARSQETAVMLDTALLQSPFDTAEEAAALAPLLEQQSSLSEQITRFREAEQQLAAQIDLLRDQLQGRTITDDQWEQCAAALQEARINNEAMLQQAAKAERDWDELKTKQERWQQLESRRAEMEQLCGRLKSLQTLFRGNAFVEYVAEEQLVQVCRAASERLGFLTKQRYALEVDSGGGFVIRDDANGALRRPVSTLSGGETFLASLALALALSSQIQLRGKYPLQFFFLDEGFGTLDPELLDTVITALEKLHNDTLSVGVISHVPELRARLPRRLIVTAAEPSVRGSSVELETM
ncbi:AAA family ATPase [Paenibacillus nasutitermitis]|uniref:Nuclease SbcCD subunit C n=1 Tax=Paenibacillus nasutitermitis TaxID=1652958 RepID=A0A916Z390_9BACL|nr:SMC family ATPase [Paenibacillus nasutitermitis]GGD71533.1 hypothetical protein GCM10010911_31810 [Paenibacillus nasutitermitis]